VHELRSALVHGEQRSTLVSKAQRQRSAGGSLTTISVRREEARQCNQRSEDRHLNVVDRAVIRLNRRKYEVDVVNVSSRGAMIAADLQPCIGAKVEISFEGCNETQCFVRWVRGGRIGLEFAKETLIIAPSNVRELIISGRRNGEQEKAVAMKKERPARHRFMIKGLLHWRLGTLPVTLRNISSEGAMLEAKQDLTAGSEVVLEVPGATAAAARVAWCRSSQIGIRFDAEFDLTTLAQPEVAPQSPRMLKPDYLKDERDPNSPWAACWDRLSPDDL
jgi:hypothetical protein